MRCSLKNLFLAVLCAAIGFTLLKAVQTAQRAALKMNSHSPLNQLSLALHNYHGVYGCFPPACITDARGRPMHSWRILVLPYMEERPLYENYDFNEPWDGPNNSLLAKQMPRMFHSPTEPQSSEFTNIVAISGDGTTFPSDRSTSLTDILDGPENTILLTEISESEVPWLKPQDLDAANLAVGPPLAPELSISAASWRRPMIVFADSIHAYTVQQGISIEELRALTTIAGNESTTKSKLLEQGDLR
ncbi:DUF1559 family PulG-like putative transporter [Aureliella helgolandensis]|uniref:DUF1559 domain-containing protein n=1 Tax=Aureliella helgolandensis TaxID=2527968 RepID=A0A518GH67_9BACT|nr:DUF1559 domain-containing protein [Aureliella helgolandensis]QDV27927.1 hypothetical protein Q31a_63200 [Aureliella helgolandensis]